MFLGVGLSASGQYTKEFKRIYFDAKYLYMTEFYDEAFSRYKNLLTLDPGNCNILFHCGACCLSIPGNESQAITYLQEAAGGVKQNYNENSHKESGAPMMTYFMLGRAYHLNNEFDRAIEYYDRYRKEGMDEDPLQLEYARLQIEACHRAEQEMIEAPSFEFQSVLDHFDEELPSCNNPVISGDGNLLIFLVDYPNDKKIMMTRRTDNVWSRPKVINHELGMVGVTYPVCLSYDGLDLYLVHEFYSHSDIFVSRFEQGRWTEAEALGNNVNGRTSETHASISKNGKTLFFTSDARGGQGSFDIYVSKLDGKGEWGVPVNLGPVINTPYEEQTPFISSNDSILFFSSQGHKTIGGFDVFYSELGKDGKWKEPVSLGYPVNTTGENLFFNPGWDELDGYYAVQRKDDPTSNTINMVIELEPAEQVAVASLTKPVETGKVKEGTQEVLHDLEKAIEPEETEEIHQVLNASPVAGEVVVHSPTTVGATRLQTSVPFEHNAFELSMAAMLEVEKVADLMQTYPETRVMLTGHADATGSSDYNLLLSNQRADQISRYLQMRGVDPSRISLEGKGESAPVARNKYPDGTDAPLGRYLNRQVTVTIESPRPIQAELTGFYVPSSLKPAPENGQSEGQAYWFTIQLHASFTQRQMSFFQGLSGVREYPCKDKCYRYACGEYRTFDEAKTQLDQLQDAGYPDAFIQTLDWYTRAVR